MFLVLPACGTEVEVGHIVPTWPRDHAAVLVLERVDRGAPPVFEVVEPGGQVALELSPGAEYDLSAVSYASPSAEQLVECGASLNPEGLLYRDPQSLSTARISTLEHIQNIALEPGDLSTFPYALRSERCEPPTLSGTWLGTMTVYFVFAAELDAVLELADENGSATGTLRTTVPPNQVILPMFTECLSELFTVSATRAEGDFRGIASATCPSPPCTVVEFEGQLRAQQTMVATFSLVDGACRGGTGTLDLAR